MPKRKRETPKRNLWISVIVSLVLLPVFTVIWCFYGPFEPVRRAWICTAMSTANHKYLATVFFSEETVKKYTTQYFSSINELPKQDKSAVSTDNNGGKTTKKSVRIGLSKGVLLKIPNPSKIDISVCNNIGGTGMTLDKFIIQEKAIAGINAGAYADKNGSAHGSVPDGLIIKDGKTVYFNGDTNEEFCVIGFDEDNLLVVDYVKSKSEAEELNLRCAVSFGPPLILNGKGLITETGTSLQPRSAIAQCADGSVLLLVLDGRQPSSAGATLKNVQDLLLEHGAVTAANLDGGSSAAMIFEGELLNSPSDKGELKKIPTAFVVKE